MFWSHSLCVPERTVFGHAGAKSKSKSLEFTPMRKKTLLHNKQQEQVQGTRSIHGRSIEPTTPHPTECKYPSSLFGVLVVRRLASHLPLQVLVGAVALYTPFATTTRSAILPPTVLSSVDDRRIEVKSEVCYHHSQPSFPPSTLPMQQPLQSLLPFCVKTSIRTTMWPEIFHPPATHSHTPALLGRPVASQPGSGRFRQLMPEIESWDFEVALCSL